jgi:hypothetical protein
MLGEYNLFTGGYEPIEKSRKLKDVELTEISLVSEPANKRKFLFFKRGDSGELEGELGELVSRINGLDVSEEKKTELIAALDNTDNVEQISEIINNLSEVQTVEKSINDPWPSLGGLTDLALLQGQGVSSDELED